MSEKVLFSWSSGKDSALSLYELQKTHGYEISALLTTVTADYGRISIKPAVSLFEIPAGY